MYKNTEKHKRTEITVKIMGIVDAGFELDFFLEDGVFFLDDMAFLFRIDFVVEITSRQISPGSSDYLVCHRDNY